MSRRVDFDIDPEYKRNLETLQVEGNQYQMSYSDNSDVSRHLETKTYKCGVCQTSFSEISDWMDHVMNPKKHQETLTSGEQLKCQLCGLTFRNQSFLKVHFQNHKEGKHFTCDICGKAYCFKETLKIHLQLHKEETPFKCSTCNQSFPTESHLQRHYFNSDGCILELVNTFAQENYLTEQHSTPSPAESPSGMKTPVGSGNLFGQACFSEPSLHSELEIPYAPDLVPVTEAFSGLQTRPASFDSLTYTRPEIQNDQATGIGYILLQEYGNLYLANHETVSKPECHYSQPMHSESEEVYGPDTVFGSQTFSSLSSPSQPFMFGRGSISEQSLPEIPVVPYVPDSVPVRGSFSSLQTQPLPGSCSGIISAVNTDSLTYTGTEIQYNLPTDLGYSPQQECGNQYANWNLADYNTLSQPVSPYRQQTHSQTVAVYQPETDRRFGSQTFPSLRSPLQSNDSELWRFPGPTFQQKDGNYYGQAGNSFQSIT